MADFPEELRAWELSIIDEQAPVLPVDNNAALQASPVAEPGSTPSLAPSDMDSPMVLAGVYPPSISSSSTIDSPHAISPYLHLNNNPLLAAAANTSLPARMCTVSHCHKILPGYYRYKRCEQHRLQNRHHSQLKRVREKEVKAAGPEEGAKLAELPPEMAEKDKEEKEKDPGKAAISTGGTEEGKEARVLLPDVAFPSMTGGTHGEDSQFDSEGKKDESHDQVR